MWDMMAQESWGLATMQVLVVHVQDLQALNREMWAIIAQESSGLATKVPVVHVQDLQPLISEREM
jgi:hypothetical protein